MKPSDLHQRLSRDATYVKARAELAPVMRLAAACMAVCERRKISRRELVAATGVASRAIHAFENFRRVKDEDISAIVRYLKPWLEEDGVEVEPWLQGAHPEAPMPTLDPRRVMAERSVPGYRHGRGVLPVSGLPCQ